MLKLLFSIFSLIFLAYLLLPAPSKIEDFSSLPDSVKSEEPGDTIQNPNISAYFSDLYRSEVIPFYKNDFNQKFSYFGINLPFTRLNHPPEKAVEVIRPYQQSYYLEELVHPMRESLYINGWEPYDEKGNKRYKYSHGLVVNGREFISKTTLRYYPSPLWIRLVGWAGVMLAILFLYQLARRSLKEKYV
jgi:hypothetical protein